MVARSSIRLANVPKQQEKRFLQHPVPDSDLSDNLLGYFVVQG